MKGTAISTSVSCNEREGYVTEADAGDAGDLIFAAD
jgi:hypothetical protein